MKIKSITPAGYADVYNVKVDKAHTFIANHGFTIHNCDEARYFMMSRPIKAEAEREAEPVFFDPLNQFKK